MVRKIGIRMINRIHLPMDGGRLLFGDFLTVSPQLPETGSPLSFLGFLDQQMALVGETGNRVVREAQLEVQAKEPPARHADIIGWG